MTTNAKRVLRLFTVGGDKHGIAHVLTATHLTTGRAIEAIRELEGLGYLVQVGASHDRWWQRVQA